MTMFYDRHIKSYVIFNQGTLSYTQDRETGVRNTTYYIHDHGIQKKNIQKKKKLR